MSYFFQYVLTTKPETALGNRGEIFFILSSEALSLCRGESKISLTGEKRGSSVWSNMMG